MKNSVLALFAAAVLVVHSGFAHAEEIKKLKPIAVKGKLTMTATVMAVDAVARTLTVKGPNGTRTLPVDERVARFKQIKAGDRINAQYYEAVVIDLVRMDPRAASDAAAAPTEEKKSGEGIAQTVLTAIVWGIDPGTPALTLRVGEAAAQNFRVRGEKYLRDLKMGDTVVVTLADALIFAADPAK